MKSPVICLSHSMKQKDQAETLARVLTWKGCVVLPPIDMRESVKKVKNNPKLVEDVTTFFMALQYQRILLADLVVAIPKKTGKFGEAVSKEVMFAQKYGRTVISFNSEKDIESDKIKEAIATASTNTYADLSTLLIKSLDLMEHLNVNETLRANLQNILVDVDHKLFSDYKVTRDSMTNILKDIKE